MIRIASRFVVYAITMVQSLISVRMRCSDQPPQQTHNMQDPAVRRSWLTWLLSQGWGARTPGVVSGV